MRRHTMRCISDHSTFGRLIPRAMLTPCSTSPIHFGRGKGSYRNGRISTKRPSFQSPTATNVSRSPRRRAAERNSLCERCCRPLPRRQRIERPYKWICRPPGGGGLWRPFRKPSRDSGEMSARQREVTQCWARKSTLDLVIDWRIVSPSQ
jgi:hypothetical protein